MTIYAPTNIYFESGKCCCTVLSINYHRAITLSDVEIMINLIISVPAHVNEALAAPLNFKNLNAMKS